MKPGLKDATCGCNACCRRSRAWCGVRWCAESCTWRSVQWEAFSDGACRGDGFSSFAWIIYATWQVGNEQYRFTVAFGYEILVGNYSSFVTELLGLERAVGVTLQLYRHEPESLHETDFVFAAADQHRHL